MINFNDSDFLAGEHKAAELVKHEKEQFRKFESFPYPQYLKERRSYLEKHSKDKFSIQWLENFTPSIAVFAGSFNPFHRGHFNVLQKAEKIFDKVIIAFGNNPEKQSTPYKVPRTIGNRQIAEYDGLLTDFISSLGHEAVVIRGLRNSTDFQYEQNQYRYIQELMPEIMIVNIFCDKEFEHISSSGIRTLERYGRHGNYLLD
jgi:pantetheine-phosphate adenylyltransferase